LDEVSRDHELSSENLLVVADDIDLPLGRIRIRAGGSSGGHNGLESVIHSLGTDQFARIRLGVGPVPVGTDPADFVLDRFSEEELIIARDVAARAAEAVALVLARGVRAAANVYNRKPPAPEDSKPGAE
jgi:PTH1 family peptidyl-tRNA hydrolase